MFTSGKYQILCKTRILSHNGKLSYEIAKLNNLYYNDSFIVSAVLGSVRRLLAMAERVLAPLRRIISRELEVYQFHKGGLPYQFAIHDSLECGHVSTSQLWDSLDLLNAYTDNPEVSAKRRRCRPCASLLLKRKPMQTVTDIAAAKTA